MIAKARHGTLGGWNRHQRDGEKPCEDCQLASTLYIRDWRKRNLVPIELPDERFADLPGGVGLAYAYAVRESA